MRPVGYGPTTLPLHHSDRKESPSWELNETFQLEARSYQHFNTNKNRNRNSWLTGDEDPSDEDGGTGMGDSTGVLVYLGDYFLEGNKSWESNINDSDNTGDGGKIAGRAITTWGGGMASYVCMTSIFESSCKGKITSMSKRYFVKSFKESGEMLPGEAEKLFRMFVEEKVFSISESDGTIVE
uniref:Uncharacterized protein n=1 Tax=Tanacetum cinerariifolium TaxID=118510 RepID=A0A699H9L2_TANCI|nr:hypothetical protein [Tanacetum cinerariifolium]